MSVTEDFRALAEEIVDDLLALDPVSATSLGDHRFDGLLADLSSEGVAAARRLIDDHVTRLDAVDDVELPLEDLVDLEIVRARLMRTQFELADLRQHEWNPMVWNPGTALYLLMARDFAPREERARNVAARLAAVPDFLHTARGELRSMPRIHVETAINQLGGTIALIDGDARDFGIDVKVIDTARDAVTEFRDWLVDVMPIADRDPRLGERLYAATLWHSLDDDVSAAELLEDAQRQLDEVSELMADAAAEYLGGEASDDVVRDALALVADRAPVTDLTVLDLVEQAMRQATAFARDHDIVRIPDLDVQIVEMPEIHRGVAVAYCDAPGPLETAPVATRVAVAPTPSDWDLDRVRSFYREYNGVQLHTLTVHEAVPGHVLQLAHAQTLRSPTRIRRFGRSGVFVEGWAVYAEEVMTQAGYSPADTRASWLELRLQQLKMQARGVINAILDISVHAGDMSEHEALALMRDRGFQEEGEAVGKWRRALLTSGQLPTYYAGYRAVNAICADLRVLHPDWSQRQVHDLVLSAGSPAPRHLRTLLGI